MRRREFIKFLGGAAVAWPLAAHAQRSELLPVVGFINGASASKYVHLTAAFRRGLNEAGYVEGQNVLIESRWAEGHYDLLPALAADLVRRQVAVIAVNTVAAPAAKAATTTIPIVFSSVADPIKLGLVSNLNRPSGNVTGINQFTGEMAAKWARLLHEIAPKARIIGVLVNPKNTTDPALRDVQKAIRTLGQRIYVLNASSENDHRGTDAHASCRSQPEILPLCGRSGGGPPGTGASGIVPPPDWPAIGVVMTYAPKYR